MYPHPLRSRPYVVVDQNALRKAETVTILDNLEAGGPAIALPWVVWRENTKSDKPYETIVGTLKHLSRRPEAIHIAHPMHFVAAREARGIDEIFNYRQTEATRAIARDVGRGAGPALAALARDESEFKAFFETHALAANDVKVLRGLAAPTMLQVEPELLIAIRREIRTRARGTLCAVVAQICDRTALVTLLKLGRDFDQDQAERLAAAPTIASLTLVAFVRQALWWRAFGIGPLTDEKLENEAADIEYALLAAHCQGFVTRDNRARERYEDLLEISRMIWPTPNP